MLNILWSGEKNGELTGSGEAEGREKSSKDCFQSGGFSTKERIRASVQYKKTSEGLTPSLLLLGSLHLRLLL